MDWSWITGLISEVAYFLIVFGLLYVWATVRGYWSVVRIIVGLYIALPIYQYLPFIDAWLARLAESAHRIILEGIVFLVLTIITSRLCVRLIPDEGREKYFANVPKKILLSFGATVFIMSLSFHVLSVAEIITAGTPIQTLFASESSFFWWLLVPLGILFFV
jgi:hypothetical protein